jgi:hypothetical protein
MGLRNISHILDGCDGHPKLFNRVNTDSLKEALYAAAPLKARTEQINYHENTKLARR